MLSCAWGGFVIFGASIGCEDIEGGIEPQGEQENEGTGGEALQDPEDPEDPEDPQDSQDPPSTGGVGEGGAPPDLGMGGVSDAPPPDVPEEALNRCFFADLGQAPEGSGMGGAASGGGSVALAENPFLGEILVQEDGIALYTYGADSPGTCDTAPSSGCVADCAIAWPPFVASRDSLGEGLDEEDFGVFRRADGALQTTYRGWPLYTFKSDAEPGDVNGQGKGSIWHAASPRVTEVMILRNAENVKFLVDSAGFTFYVLADDEVGDDEGPPVGLCTGDCRDDFVPFRGTHLTVSTSLDATEFEIFTSPGIGRQVAFRGRPLYLHRGDSAPFDVGGLGLFGAELALF